MTESQLHNRLKGVIKSRHINIDLVRLESGSTACGIPDTWYLTPYRSGWIEMKAINRIPVNHFKVPWRPGQRAFFYRTLNRNPDLPCYLFVALENRKLLYTRLSKDWIPDTIDMNSNKVNIIGMKTPDIASVLTAL
jgi:hypothetical protein